MEAFFSGLDCRLRGSGKVADSIMMGIVNSAMETAYKKSLSKEGDLERLNEKSRFCELAIMQLEWCLKFLQEEMDIESTDDREQLLADLLETRDRIQRRLWETEIAIAEKDRELTRSRKSESKLRVALEVKGEEMSSLLTALDSERVKGERANEPVQCSKMSEESDAGHMFSECKSSVDQQICKISGKLENGRQILTTVMQKLGGSSSNIENVDPWIDDSDGMKTLSDLYNMAQLLMEFEEVIMDAGILKESIDSSFEMMVSSIDLFKTALDEHQWIANTEKEMSSIILKNILREAQYNCNVKLGSPPSQLDWSALLGDITTLQDDLVLLISKIDMQPKTDDDIKLHTHHHLSSRTHLEGRSKCDTGTVENTLHRSGGTLESGHGAGGAVDNQESSNSSHSKRLGDIGGLSKENSSGHFVTDLISNHESIIWTKSREINWLKGEISREKGNSSLIYDRKFNALKEAIAAAIERVDTIKRQKAMLVVACPDDRLQDYKGNKNNFQHNLTGFGSLEKESKSQSVRKTFQLSNNRSCCYLEGAEPCEEIRKLIEDKTKLEFQSGLLEDIYKILFKDLIRKGSIGSFDYYIKTVIMEDMFRVIICTIINEWNGIVETLDIERLLKDEIDWIIFSAITKDIIGKRYMTAIEEEHQEKLLSIDFVSGEGSDFNYDSGLMQHQFYTSFDEFNAGEHNESSIQNVEILVEEDNAFNSVSEKFEKALQQIVKSKINLRELASSLGVAADDTNATCNQITSVIDVSHDQNPSPPLIIGFPDWQWNDRQYVLMSFTQFSQELMSFELTACERIRKNISRLEDLKQKLGPLVEQVSLIKRTGVLYTKAFTRRCYDLQTAEAEVDLLGDQVDILLGFIEKIYIELDHYSPVLQHHVGMTEILDSLKKELDVELSRLM